jgi:hypothetical protein
MTVGRRSVRECIVGDVIDLVLDEEFRRHHPGRALDHLIGPPVQYTKHMRSNYLCESLYQA